MKLTFILSVCVMVQLFAEVNAQTVNLKKQNASLEEIIWELKEKTRLVFLYSDEDIVSVKGIDIDVKDLEVDEVLRKCLEGTGLQCVKENEAIIIRRAKDEPAVPQVKTRKVTGKVLDTEGGTLPGVTVMIEGTSIGTTTNPDGTYVLECPDIKGLALLYSFIGMKTKRVEIGDKEMVNVVLEEDVTELEEAVAMGIYTRNIETFTGSVATFKTEELKQIAPQGILQSLSVLDPSFIITENRAQGSNPNALLDISINGKINVTDLTQEYSTDPNQPLFILDGFETTLESIQDLNMDRVESISILKDASATAIYGSRAANGVVVVETIKAKQGRLRFSYNGNFTIGWADLSDFNLMNAAEKLEYEKLAGVYKDSGGANLDENGEIISETQRARYYARLKLVQEGYDTYWMNEPLRTAFTQGHNVFIDGGDQAFTYGVGVSYNNTQGVMKNSNRDVLNGNIRLTYRLNNLSFTNHTTIGQTKAENNTVSFSAYSQMNPFYAKRTEDGEVSKYVYRESLAGANNYDYVWNPLWDAQQNSMNETENWSLTNNFQIEYRLLRYIRIRGNLQYQMTKGETEIFRSPNETSFASVEAARKGTYSKSNSSTSSLTGRVNLSYGRTFGNHTLNGVGGMQFSDKKQKSSAFGAQGYTTDQFSSPNFASSYVEGKPSASDDQTRSVSYYLNLNYAYHMRYLLDFNLTSNGASQFGINDPFSTTWAIGAGWNIHNENFLMDSKVISLLKLRYSLGNPGNQNYDAKLSSSIYMYNTSRSNPFGLAATVNTWGNNNLKWQRTVTHNFGLDLQLFKSRLNFHFDYQMRDTDPLLVRIDMPASTGSTTAPMNVGATDNRSVSLRMTYYVIKKRDLNWYISGNLNHNTTKYKKIGNLLEEYNKRGQASSSLMRFYDNASTTGVYLVRSAGIDPATGNEVFIRKDGSYTYEWNQNDEVLVGDSNPKVSGSLQTSLVYKSFSFGASFTYRAGGMTQLSTLFNKVENIGTSQLKYNQDKRALYDRWQKPGDKAKFKRIDDTNTTRLSSRFAEKENIFQCNSINVGYRTSTAPWLKYIGASAFNFTAYMNDIFRISTIKEERGTSYPFERSVSFSIGLNF
ncbi:MAG: SusC/RagA family TonB-linked outer membrane protein [Odoribacter sp.]|nr:SusC/RagA family TonB-linked outer membrane protein [Odoribacter sp.]